jgi:hypothetical protein
VSTSPEFDSIHKDLYAVVHEMHKSLERIDRIDGIVFPLLKLDEKYLSSPDLVKNKSVKGYIEVIDQVIESSLLSSKE